MRCAMCLALGLLGLSATAGAQVSIGVGFPGVRIGVNFGAYPDLVQVPGYPVYYAPQADSNLFFYDGLYWVYAEDGWYASSWYNGPWQAVDPEAVPLFILRIPVRYYRRPPQYFRGWGAEAPPHWGDHWGPDWAQRRSGWDRWDRASAPAPAPLPSYQRQYSGNRYPDANQQQAIRRENYHYQAHEAPPRGAAPRAQPGNAVAPQRGPDDRGAQSPRRDVAVGTQRPAQPVRQPAERTRPPQPAPQQAAQPQHAPQQPTQRQPQRGENARQSNPPGPPASRQGAGPQARQPQREAPQSSPQGQDSRPESRGQSQQSRGDSDKGRDH